MTPRLKYAAIFLLIALVVAHEGMSMDEPGPEAESQRNSLHEHWKTRTFHWLVSLFILVITPSVGAAYAVANRTIVSIGIQVICQIYAFLEALFFRFNDVNGHENSTSRGTAWFMVFFYIGLIVNGLAAKRIQSKVINITYKVLSCAVVLLGLIKLAMSVVAMLGFCYDSHTGQCNAHGIMGMSFIFYGFILSMSLTIPWLRHNNGRYSQEMYDSTVITIWGIINTFTEHRPWEPWSHSDYQHTSMGIIFWCAGMLGMYLSLGKKRNFVPALTLIFTGYAMSEHVQELIISTKVHAFFGIVLMAGGFSRIMEISFLLDDQDEPVDKEIRSFQYLAPFALVLSGVLFMSATEEQLQLVVNMGADHSAYILVIISAACLLQLWILSILQLYLNLATANDSYKQVGEELELSDLEV